MLAVVSSLVNCSPSHASASALSNSVCESVLASGSPSGMPSSGGAPSSTVAIGRPPCTATSRATASSRSRSACFFAATAFLRPVRSFSTSSRSLCTSSASAMQSRFACAISESWSYLWHEGGRGVSQFAAPNNHAAHGTAAGVASVDFFN